MALLNIITGRFVQSASPISQPTESCLSVPPPPSPPPNLPPLLPGFHLLLLVTCRTMECPLVGGLQDVNFAPPGKKKKRHIHPSVTLHPHSLRLPSPVQLPVVLLEARSVQTLLLHFRAALNNVSSRRCRKCADRWCRSSAFATIIPLGRAEVPHSGKCSHRHKQKPEAGVKWTGLLGEVAELVMLRFIQWTF